MEEVKDRMFQYAYDTGSHEGMYHFSNIHIPEDTGLITEKEAGGLFSRDTACTIMVSSQNRNYCTASMSQR